MSKKNKEPQRYLPKDLRRIEFDKGYFDGAEHRYFIEADILATGRYQEYEKLAMYLAFGTSPKEQAANWEKVHNLTTSGNNVLKALSDTSTIAFNQLNAIADIQKKDYEPRVLWFCTVFCNREGEDRTKWSEDLGRRKIQDWKAVNIPMQDFFLLTRLVLKDWAKIYDKLQANQREGPTFQSKRKPNFGGSPGPKKAAGSET